MKGDLKSLKSYLCVWVWRFNYSLRYQKRYGTGTSFRTAKYFPSYRTAAAQCIDQFGLMAAQPLFGN
jgi:hypothetical protein